MNQPKTRDELVAEIKRLGPWHHDIQITDDLCTGEVFSPTRQLQPPQNEGVSLISPREGFLKNLKLLFPDGLEGRRFLDCACNAGAYCFFARELGADFAFGFDVRKHWVDQADFILANRVVAPVDRVEIRELDLYDLPKQDLEPFDITYFSGIFYHLPDPITGLKIAADLTTDVLVLSTSMVPGDDNPLGMTLVWEGVKPVMSGVYELAWSPNNPETLRQILGWAGFKDVKMINDATNPTSNRRRVKLMAAREPGRLSELPGTQLE
jgi:SAM-dependent methyltransferase